jgi:hypothetical protein
MTMSDHRRQAAALPADPGGTACAGCATCTEARAPETPLLRPFIDEKTAFVHYQKRIHPNQPHTRDDAMRTALPAARPDEPVQPATTGCAAVILGGGLKPPPLAEEAGVPIPWLAFDEEKSLLEVWVEACAIAGIIPASRLFLTDHERPPSGDRALRMVRDATPYRGPAGALRDALDAEPDTPLCAIVEGSRMPDSAAHLRDLIAAHRRSADAVTVATNPDGSFAGMLVASREVIDLIPKIGFMDIKEQWLPAAGHSNLRVGCQPISGWCASIRSRERYLSAARRLGRFGPSAAPSVIAGRSPGPFASVYGGSLISRSAQVAGDAVTAHSVVCAEARVDGGAVVVRAVVAPGAVVRKGEVVVDRVVRTADDSR